MTIPQRPRGQGSITPHGRRWRARLPARYGRRSLGVYDTYAEAEAILDAALAELAGDPAPEGMTLHAWALTVLDARESGDHKRRTVERDRGRWATYVEHSLLGRTPLLDVTERDVRRWLDGLRKQDGSRLAPTSVRNALNLVRVVLEAAVEAGKLDTNPARPVKLSAPARRKVKAARDRWTWLRADEIERVLSCDAIPIYARAAYATSIYGGLRAGELWGLRWQDVDFERGVIHVRHSFEDTPKAHQIREVAMLAPVREWLTLWRRVYAASGVRSRLDLVWPARSEAHHADGYDAGWAKRWRRAARIRREVRFHDLRHTCASHLVQGTWAPSRIPLAYLIDRPLRLEEVRDWLGHESIEVTQRYAHLCADAIRSLVVPSRPNRSGHDRDTVDSHLGELNPGPTVYETGRVVQLRAGKQADPGAVSRDVSREALRALAVRYVRAVEHGDVHRDARGMDLAEAVLDATAEAIEEQAGPAPARSER